MPIANRTIKPMLVGESNPYGSDPYFALYPAPDGCSGHRLCRLILMMNRVDYLREFNRVNLCDDGWSLSGARERAVELLNGGGKFILLGRKVCDGFGVTFAPFTIKDEILLILPHPSGLNRMWGEDGVFVRARSMVAAFAPEVAHLLGVDRNGDEENIE